MVQSSSALKCGRTKNSTTYSTIRSREYDVCCTAHGMDQPTWQPCELGQLYAWVVPTNLSMQRLYDGPHGVKRAKRADRHGSDTLTNRSVMMLAVLQNTMIIVWEKDGSGFWLRCYHPWLFALARGYRCRFKSGMWFFLSKKGHWWHSFSKLRFWYHLIVTQQKILQLYPSFFPEICHLFVSHELCIVYCKHHLDRPPRKLMRMSLVSLFLWRKSYYRWPNGTKYAVHGTKQASMFFLEVQHLN